MDGRVVMKRFLLWTGIVVGVVIAMVVLISLGYDEYEAVATTRRASDCLDDRRDYLAAQSVPGAAYVPCFTEQAAGWNVEGQSFSNDGMRVQLMSEAAPDVEWTVEFTSTCRPPAVEPVDQRGVPAEVRESTTEQPENEATERTQWMTFEGGCVVSKVVVPERIDRQFILDETNEILRLEERSTLQAEIRRQTDGKVSLDPPSTSTTGR